MASPRPPFNRTGSAPGDLGTLFAAVLDGDLARTSALLLQHPGAPQWQDRAGNTPLMMAVIAGNADIVDLLIDCGADVNAQNKHGGNALARAAHFGHKDIVEKLLAKGADPAARDAAGQDAADWALMNGHAEIAKLLRDSKKPAQPRPPQP